MHVCPCWGQAPHGHTHVNLRKAGHEQGNHERTAQAFTERLCLPQHIGDKAMIAGCLDGMTLLAVGESQPECIV
jgi:hypothetical protein